MLKHLLNKLVHSILHKKSLHGHKRPYVHYKHSSSSHHGYPKHNHYGQSYYKNKKRSYSS